MEATRHKDHGNSEKTSISASLSIIRMKIKFLNLWLEYSIIYVYNYYLFLVYYQNNLHFVACICFILHWNRLLLPKKVKSFTFFVVTWEHIVIRLLFTIYIVKIITLLWVVFYVENNVLWYFNKTDKYRKIGKKVMLKAPFIVLLFAVKRCATVVACMDFSVEYTYN